MPPFELAPLGPPDGEIEVMLSLGSVLGGVSRLPTLVMLPADGAVEVLYVGYLLFCICDSGGGSSTLGKLDAADLRAVKLE